MNVSDGTHEFLCGRITAPLHMPLYGALDAIQNFVWKPGHAAPAAAQALEILGTEAAATLALAESLKSILLALFPTARFTWLQPAGVAWTTNADGTVTLNEPTPAGAGETAAASAAGAGPAGNASASGPTIIAANPVNGAKLCRHRECSCRVQFAPGSAAVPQNASGAAPAGQPTVSTAPPANAAAAN